MTIRREWSIPIALGLVVVAGLWALQDSNNDDRQAPIGANGTTTPRLAASATLTPFHESQGPTGSVATFIVIAPKGQAFATAALNLTDQWALDRLQWTGGNEAKGVENKVAFLTGRHGECLPTLNGSACRSGGTTGGGNELPVAEALDTTGPRLGLGGYNATRATIYVFDDRGLLVATNDDKGNWSKFAGPPTTMDSQVWYIGANDTAPNGTYKPPTLAAPLIQKLRPLMEGLPTGGVATTMSNAYVGNPLIGRTLFITMRIDALVYAP